MEQENKIVFYIGPPYPLDKPDGFWGCLVQIKDKNKKVNFKNDKLYFDVNYLKAPGREFGLVNSYMIYSQYEDPEFFLYKITDASPIRFTISTSKHIDLSSLYFELHPLSKFYNQ
jgi:hypothetical protein